MKITRIDLYNVWGRALACTVGYTTDQAKALGVAWQLRRLDPHRREPREGFRFAGHRFGEYHRTDAGREVIGYCAHGPIAWPSMYDAARARIGQPHDGLLELAMDELGRFSIDELDTSSLGARVLQDMLRRTSLDPLAFRHCQIATIERALQHRAVTCPL